MSVIRTTNKSRRQRNIKWGIYNGYILATSASQTLACYKISWQYGLLFRLSCSQPTHSSCRHSRSPFLLLLGYTVPRSGLFKPTPDLTPKASLSRSWNSLAIKPRAVAERERDVYVDFYILCVFIFSIFTYSLKHHNTAQCWCCSSIHFLSLRSENLPLTTITKIGDSKTI